MASTSNLVAQTATELSSYTVIANDFPSTVHAGPSVSVVDPSSSNLPSLVVNLAKPSTSSPLLPVSLLIRASTPASLLSFLPHIRQIASLPIVIHVAVSGDHAPIFALRSAGLYLIYSSDATKARDNAALSAKLAVAGKRAVVHWFDADGEGESEKVEALSPPELTALKGWVLGSKNEIRGNGHANGHANGHSNGHSNGHANGNGASTNGHVQPVDGPALPAFVSEAYSTLSSNLRHPSSVRPHFFSGPSSATSLVVAVGPSSSTEALSSALSTASSSTAVLSLSLYRPLTSAYVASLIPSSVRQILVLEPSRSSSTQWSPLYLDVLAAAASSDEEIPDIVSGTLGKVDRSSASKAAASVTSLLSGGSDSTGKQIVIGTLPVQDSEANVSKPRAIPKHEQAYSHMLEQIFGSRLNVANAPQGLIASAGSEVEKVTNPEYALGKILAESREKDELKEAVGEYLSQITEEGELEKSLKAWLVKPGDVKVVAKVEGALASSTSSASTERIRSLSSHFNKQSTWIIGSDAWSYDLGNSGVHHALATGKDVNLLIVDTQPFVPPSETSQIDALAPRKKDIGLYAMNYGSAYVASVAVYGDYSQAARAIVEADAYPGPSIVLAYLPLGHKDDVSALQVLKETKRAIEIGSWPLYRWNPSNEAKKEAETFELDSERVKAELRAFLDRHNHLTLLSRRNPLLSDSLESSYGTGLLAAQKRKAKQAFEALSGALDGPPLLILYASDGGNAEKVAKRLAQRARARGLAGRVMTMDDFPVEDLALESNVAFVTSVAGQGEFPQNGREFWKSLGALKVPAAGPTGGDGKNLDNVRFTVFAMGDSHYWPRPEDAHYYNKAGKDLDKKLGDLGAERMADIGLGDDQDADGPQTGYKEWEPRLWKALGVEDVEVVEAEPEPITNEHIKIASNYLRGTIAEGLVDSSTGALAESDGQLTKFHGIYQQDDRDIRDDRKNAGLEPAYSFMVRVRMPAGVCRPDQWQQIDKISDERGNGTFKLTTRQTFQFHGIIKSNLKPAIQNINRALLDTIAACGDVNRNVMCAANPSVSELHSQVYQFAKGLSQHLLPHTSAYSEIWLDKKLVAGDAVKDVEPLYGPYYLPRKFKVGVAVPPSNDVDIFTNDVGFIAIVEPSTGKLAGFNVSIGGGMGVTHSNKKTYPRLGDVIGFVAIKDGEGFLPEFKAAEAIMLTQRDNGDRTNRKHARLKYTIDDMGLDNFKAAVEKRGGFTFAPAREFHFESNIDTFGWTTHHDGRKSFTAFIENGRVQDEPGKPFKTGLREIAKVHKGVFRLTPNQHLIIADVPAEEVPTIEKLLKEYHLDNIEHTGLRLSSSACVAFPTCGLAMAESERFLPVLIDRVEKICEENGLRNDSLVMRMTGCPNGCARPYVAEVAFVGKAPGQYLMLLGGGYHGQRLNKIYKESVTEEEIVEILGPMIKRYAIERHEGEHFGDWTIRAGVVAPTTSGKEWYENVKA